MIIVSVVGAGLVMTAAGAGWLASSPALKSPNPVEVRELRKSDRLELAQPAPITPEAPPVKPRPVPPIDTPVPPDQVEEERDERMPRTVDPPAVKRAVPKERDICARTGGKRVEYERHGRQGWRCRYD